MPPYRIESFEEAKADVRVLDRPTAMQLFEGVLRFARTDSGDVAALHPAADDVSAPALEMANEQVGTGVPPH